MSYIPPTFNLSVNYWENTTFQTAWAAGAGAVPAPTAVYQGQLRGWAPEAIATIGLPAVVCSRLLLPVGTDIRALVAATNEWVFWCPVVEVPAASGRFYFVTAVEDTAKGFDNEYRQAVIFPSYLYEGTAYSALANWPYAPVWPTPYP